jgi:hypothetical protein
MKRLFATLVMLTGTIAVNAQQISFTLFPKQAPIKHMSKNFVCSCHTNYTNQMTSLLKSKANAEWFEKMTTLTVDTNIKKPSDTTYQASTYRVRENMTIDELRKIMANVNPDRMPIAKPNNTDPRMPIVKTDRTAYNMPIVGNKKSKPQIILNYKTKSGADSLVYVK